MSLADLRDGLEAEALALQKTAWARPDGGQDCSLSTNLAVVAATVLTALIDPPEALVEAVASAIDDIPDRLYFSRRAIDKSCWEVVHDTDPDGPISDTTFKVLHRYSDPNAAKEKVAELARSATARASIAAAAAWLGEVE